MQQRAPRGTQDFFGEKMDVINFIEDTCRDLLKKFNINELRTPTFEHTELFLRGVGETTDIVSKEMYTFMDKGDRSLTLKPEGTAGAVRAYIENKMYAGTMPVKLYYLTSCFRYEKPQAGRFREFHQLGVEYFGSYDYKTEVEVIAFCDTLLKALGITNVELRINSLGDNECRAKYNDTFKTYIDSKKEHLCDTCKERADKNPLRTLDCKNPDCQEVLKDAPVVLDVLGEECTKHFEGVKSGLDALGIKYTVDAKMVRGLDYYTKTVFEFVTNDIGAQGTVLGGGRYDNLVEEFEGPKTGAVGFGLGIERALMLIMKNGANIESNVPEIYIGSLGEKEALVALKLAQDLRINGINAESDVVGRTLKNQMKYADKSGAIYSTIIGESEVETRTLTIKKMETGEQRQVEFDKLFDFFRSSK